jgi:hypothetical protein
MTMTFTRFLALMALSTGLAGIAQAGGPASTPASITPYLITNDDLPPKIATSGTFFTFAADGTPQNPTRVSLGGVGSGGGYFAANHVSVLNSATQQCAFLSLGGSGEVGAVDIQALQDVGNFSAATTDSGFDNGIGLANNGSYVYAAFSTSVSLATFAIQPGCQLQYMSSISAPGMHAGSVKGMAVHGNLMILAYGDGSIQSFNISAGVPVSNGDLQNATGYTSDFFPVGVDITQDGHFAIFGDAANTATVEVSDISSGKLTKTVIYRIGTAFNSNNVLLSPDETLLYIANTIYGRVTAAFFDKTTGKVTPGCVSPKLRGFDTNWAYVSSPVTELASGTGSVLYLAEFGTGIAMINVTSSGGKCTLTEAATSPIQAPNTTVLTSIGVYPPRSF